MSKDHFDVDECLHQIKHYLPAQAPLKDFVHHNTLHAFQAESFFEATARASAMLGCKVSLSLRAFREMYKQDSIPSEHLDKAIRSTYGDVQIPHWREMMLNHKFEATYNPFVGQLRASWKNLYKVDMNTLTHTRLFRILNSYLDQGISIWQFPVTTRGFMSSLRELEKYSKVSLFNSDRVQKLFQLNRPTITQLLDLLVGRASLYENYLFDLQFAHPGWSGMVAFIESNPDALLDKRQITLEEAIILELLLEIDVLDTKFGTQWKPLGLNNSIRSIDLFKKAKVTNYQCTLQLWQQAFENTFYDEVLTGIQKNKVISEPHTASFQAFMCIDDRECSWRRYIEQLEPNCQTFGTPGHFGLEYYFQPENGKFHTKVCPAPVTPKILVKEFGATAKLKRDVHFSKHTHGILGAFLLTHTYGFISAFKLAFSIFKPSFSPAANSSFNFMDATAKLTIEHVNEPLTKDGLQIGFTLEQMTLVVEKVLKSTGLTHDFAPIIYMIGHGASSVNNTYYAGYDCGACCGRPGSVNARIFATIANKPSVRSELIERGIFIPEGTQFIGGLHDTTRDEVTFFDEEFLTSENATRHLENIHTFNNALTLNAKERSRRFVTINTKASAAKIHAQVKKRSITIFEPRPELNHASNCLCVVGRREMTKGLFLDRRAFMNSYDCKQDPDGTFLLTILNAAAPVCGGINLEYYFSRVDNHKLGAGSKLPHNVIGLNAIANGIEGDLRPGLPTQMTELHDPLRLLMIIEHYPEVILSAIKSNPVTYEWFKNEWVNMVAVNPDTKKIYRFSNEEFMQYDPLDLVSSLLGSLVSQIENSSQNISAQLAS